VNFGGSNDDPLNLMPQHSKSNHANATSPPSILQLFLTLSSSISCIPLPPTSSSVTSHSSAASSLLPTHPHTHLPRLIQQLSTEVLALTSSDTLVRKSVIALSNQVAEEEEEELRREGIQVPERANGSNVFFDLILQWVEEMKETDSEAWMEAQVKRRKRMQRGIGCASALRRASFSRIIDHDRTF